MRQPLFEVLGYKMETPTVKSGRDGKGYIYYSELDSDKKATRRYYTLRNSMYACIGYTPPIITLPNDHTRC